MPKIMKQYLGDTPVGSDPSSSGEPTLIPVEVNYLANDSTSDQIKAAFGGDAAYNQIIRDMYAKKRVVFNDTVSANLIYNVDYRNSDDAMTLDYAAFGFPGSEGISKSVMIMRDPGSGNYSINQNLTTYVTNEPFRFKGQIPYVDADGSPLSGLSVGALNQILTVSDSGLPSWKDLPAYTKAQTNAISLQTYNAAKAYTDSLVTQYETTNFYLVDSVKLSDTKPTGVGTEVTYSLDTTKKLLGTFTFTLKNAGIALKNNLYNLILSFESVSTSRVTYIEAVYKLGDLVIFDVESELNNTASSYTLERMIENEQLVDLNYDTGDVITLELWGYVSSGTDAMRLVVNDLDRISGLYRNAPIANLTASLITTTKNGTVMTQQEFNDSVGSGGSSGAYILRSELLSIQTTSTSAQIEEGVGGLAGLQAITDATKAKRSFVFGYGTARSEDFQVTPLSIDASPTALSFVVLSGQNLLNASIHHTGTDFVCGNAELIPIAQSKSFSVKLQTTNPLFTGVKDFYLKATNDFQTLSFNMESFVSSSYVKASNELLYKGPGIPLEWFNNNVGGVCFIPIYHAVNPFFPGRPFFSGTVMMQYQGIDDVEIYISFDYSDTNDWNMHVSGMTANLLTI